MAAPPTGPSWTTGEVVTEAKLDQITAAIAALRSPPRCVMFATGVGQSIPHNTHTAVEFNGEFDDSDNGHDVAVNNTRYTAPYTGEYLCIAAIPFSANNTAHKAEINFMRNGTDWFSGAAIMKTTSNVTIMPNASALIYLEAGWYVEVMAYQNRGSALTLDPSFKSGPNFYVVMMSSL